MRLISTTFIVFLLLAGSLFVSIQNSLSATGTTLKMQLDKYSTQVASQDGNGSSEFDTPPKIKGGFKALQDKIVYPEEAKQQNIEGRVIVEISINTQGKVTEATVVDGIEKGGLNKAALDAVKQISFTPALLNQRPVSTTVQLPIQFKLGV